MDHWRQGGNLGVGIGYQFEQSNRLSVYTYFDLTVSRSKHLFNQLTPGFSYTHPIVASGKDYGEIACYLNGYFPLKSLEKNVSSPKFAQFQGNNFLVQKTDRYALTGSNLEIGYYSKYWSDFNFYVAGSGYYFKRAELHGFGGYGKFRATYRDLLSAEIKVSGDRLFGTNVTGTFGIRIPLGKREFNAIKNKTYCLHKSRPVERFEPIVLKKVRRKMIAKDSNGIPLNFIFVNNLNGSNGGFEDPFATLLDAQMNSKPGDYIYLFPGNGTTMGYDKGFVMQERQTFAGSGTPLTVSTSNGSIVIPAQTAMRPVITNTAGDGVDIARDCTVSGIVVDGATSSGFTHTNAEGSSNVKLLSCTASNNTNGFQVLNVSSSSLTAILTNCDGSSNSIGIFINNGDSGPLSANLTGCDNYNNSSFGIFIRNESSGPLTANFTDCANYGSVSHGTHIRNDGLG
jgi:hypothetical protein